MLRTFANIFSHFTVLLSEQCWHFILEYLFAALWTHGYGAFAENECLFLRSSAICQRFLGGEQWWLWGLQTDLTASSVGTFHQRFSYKCAQSRQGFISTPEMSSSESLRTLHHISALTVFCLSVLRVTAAQLSYCFRIILHVKNWSEIAFSVSCCIVTITNA